MEDAVKRVDRSSADGAVAVEFAILLPLLVLILFGIMQFGLFFFRWHGMQNMANVGARAGSIGLTVEEIRDRLLNANSVPVADSDITIAIEKFNGTSLDTTYDLSDSSQLLMSPCQGNANPEDYLVRVTLTIDKTLDQYNIVIPVWGSIKTNYTTAATYSCEASS